MDTPEFYTPPPQPPTQPAPPYPPYPPGAPPPPPTSGSQGLAITSMVLGILGFMTSLFIIGGLFGLLAVIFGIISLVKKRAGKGLAIAGLITGGISFLTTLLMIVITLLAYSGIQERASDTSTAESVRSIELRVAAHHALKGEYPTYDELVNATEAEVKLDSDVRQRLYQGDETTVTRSQPIAYQGCSSGALIYHWHGSSAQDVRATAIGNPDDCANIEIKPSTLDQPSDQVQRL